MGDRSNLRLPESGFVLLHNRRIMAVYLLRKAHIRVREREREGDGFQKIKTVWLKSCNVRKVSCISADLLLFNIFEIANFLGSEVSCRRFKMECGSSWRAKEIK